MSIYITGDIHGEYERFSLLTKDGKETLSEQDTLIICGDFGFLFTGIIKEKAILDRMEQKPYTICFCDGNHENFNLLNEYPIEIWNGGKIHRIRNNIIHLMRGQVFTLEGKRFFTMGGVYSVDRYLRELNVSYWLEELPNNGEYKEATANLESVDHQVNYIISHTAPREIIRRMGYEPVAHDLELTGFLEWVMYTTKFQKWYFGHWHEDMEIGNQFRAVYFNYIKLQD